MEWLDDVVVGTVFQPSEPVNRLGPRSDHNDRKIALFPNLARQLESVFVAEQEIKCDQADVWLGVEAIEHGCRAARLRHGKPFGFQRTTQRGAHHRFVVDDQNMDRNGDLLSNMLVSSRAYDNECVAPWPP